MNEVVVSPVRVVGEAELVAVLVHLVHVHDVVQGDEVGLVVHVENRRFDVLGLSLRFS